MATETGDGTTESEVDTDSESGFSSYMRSVTVTTGATLAGISAAIAAVLLELNPQETTAGVILVGAILVQFLIYKLIGIDTDSFGTKDYLYISFMTFVLWFISWSIMLTAGT